MIPPPRHVIALAVFWLLFSLAGCRETSRPATQASAQRPTSVGDQRIISLSPALTELLFALGCGDQVVARDGWSDHPKEATSLPALPGLVPEVESILALRPDLVVVHFPPPRLLKGLRLANVRVAGFKPESLSQIGASFEAVGALCGRAAAGKELRRRWQASLMKPAAHADGLRVYVELDPGGGRPHTVGPGSFIQDLIEAAGGRGVFHSGGPWPQVSMEEVLSRAPDLIVSLHRDTQTGRQLILGRPGFERWRQGACLAVIHPDLISRPGPRLLAGLQVLRKHVAACQRQRRPAEAPSARP